MGASSTAAEAFRSRRSQRISARRRGDPLPRSVHLSGSDMRAVRQAVTAHAEPDYRSGCAGIAILGRQNGRVIKRPTPGATPTTSADSRWHWVAWAMAPTATACCRGCTPTRTGLSRCCLSSPGVTNGLSLDLMRRSPHPQRHHRLMVSELLQQRRRHRRQPHFAELQMFNRPSNRGTTQRRT